MITKQAKKQNNEIPNPKLFTKKENLLMNKIKLFWLLPAIAFAACSKDSVEETEVLETVETSNEIVQTDLTEVANPDNPGTVTDVFFAGMRIPVEELEGEYVYQGDILFSKDMVTSEPVKLVYEKGETPSPQKSVGRTSGRWPNNTVYYAIDGNLDNQQRVFDAIKHWESNTNLTFEKRSSQQNYIYFVSGSGCSSYIGMVGGKQNITLSSSCSTGNTIHEIGHAIGLWHEQSRVDRGKYVTIKYENIQSGMEHNFKTYQEQGFDGKEFTGSLDFESIMMYGAYSFSKNGQPTITRTNGSTYSVQRSVLSTGDKTGINNMYPYKSTTSTTVQPTAPVEPVYVNGEYYSVEGVMVYRDWNRWWYYTRSYGWKEVKLSSVGFWYYV